MNFDAVEKIAAAILYEGYILYPYRPTAIKNRQRWNFGTLYPRVYAQAQRPEGPFRLVAECIVEAGAEASLDIKISFLQLLRQPPEPALTDPSLAWDEAVERTSEHCNLRVKDLAIVADHKFIAENNLSSRPERSLVAGPAVHSNPQIELTVSARTLPEGAYKLHLEMQNTSSLPSGAAAKRDEALPLSLVSAHLLLGITGGQFVSLLDPADAHRSAVATCSSIGVFPVLAGEEPDRSIMFCSPIILYDYPKIAPESEGDFFDGTEMDEMLTLRVLALTDAEKQEMRTGDLRARRILERTEALTSDAMLKAHGVIRGLRDIRGETP
jgi:hypothetical protein